MPFTPPTTLPDKLSLIPSGFDRAGDTTYGPLGIGTATNFDASILESGYGINIATLFQDVGTFFEELPDSPTWERAEQSTITHRYACDYDTAIMVLTTYGRGKVLQDSENNLTRILSCRMDFQRGNFCIITVTAEGLNFDNPPDEFSIEINELGPAMDRHPRYNMLSYKERHAIRSNNNAGGSVEFQQQYQQVIGTIKDPTHLSASLELSNKLWKGEETFYLPGFRVQWTQYYWGSPTLNPGGYIENPIINGGLPAFFYADSTAADYDPVNPENGHTIFDNLSNFNPNIFVPSLYQPNNVGSLIKGENVSWLRLADTVAYQRTWFRLVKTWLGAPIGHWDAQIYSAPGYTPMAYDVDQNSGGLPAQLF
jgi:hypothetical protein